MFSPTCKLQDYFIQKEGETVIIDSVDANNEKDSAQYPLFAKVNTQKSTKPKDNKANIEDNKVKPENPKKSKVEFVTTVPDKDSLIGKEYPVCYGGKDSKYFVLGGYCKLHNEIKIAVGKKVCIIEIANNPDAEINGLPYLVTKVDLGGLEPKKEANPDQAADDILANMDSD